MRHSQHTGTEEHVAKQDICEHHGGEARLAHSDLAVISGGERPKLHLRKVQRDLKKINTQTASYLQEANDVLSAGAFIRPKPGPQLWQP